MPDFARLRLGMVDGQLRVADVTDHRVLEAFLAVPREDFVPAERRGLAYLDARVPLAPGRAMMEPMILGKLVQLAAPEEGERVLVLGAGLGYVAALFDALDAAVVGVESNPSLAAAARAALQDRPNVRIVEGALPEGAPGEAPFDLIFCEGAVEEGIEPLARQLAPAGRIVAPAGRSRPPKATIFRRRGDAVAAYPAFDAPAPVLPGFEAIPAFAL